MTENKFLNILIFAGFLFVTGIIYQNFYRPAEIAPVPESGRTVEIQMRSLKNQWVWDPSEIRVAPGDRVIIRITNEDGYDHGFALEAFGINARIFAHETREVRFIASKAGEFSFYCSVPCGEGHYRQTGKIIVRPGTLEAGDSSFPVEHPN